MFPFPPYLLLCTLSTSGWACTQADESNLGQGFVSKSSNLCTHFYHFLPPLTGSTSSAQPVNPRRHGPHEGRWNYKGRPAVSRFWHLVPPTQTQRRRLVCAQPLKTGNFLQAYSIPHYLTEEESMVTCAHAPPGGEEMKALRAYSYTLFISIFAQTCLQYCLGHFRRSWDMWWSANRRPAQMML